jgi:protein-tyrosine phosphatase
LTPRILFVCLGNICRSPTAEGVVRALAAGRGLEMALDSAGTGDWHLGEPPDRRMQRAARAAGYDLSGQRARQVRAKDLAEFDLILAMDRSNLAALERLRRAAGGGAPAALFLPFGRSGREEVPDPYFEHNFDEVVGLVEEAGAGLLDRVAEDWDGLRARLAAR